MREVLRDGHSEPRAALAGLVGVGSAIGIGAMSGLDGEVTIFEATAYVARVQDGALVVGLPAEGDHATLLTLAYVPRWVEHTLETSAGDEDLEFEIEKMARNEEVNTKRPFPFVLEGTMSALSLHVINGACPASPTANRVGSPEPWRLDTQVPTRATLVGFYAEGREGEMTHHGSSAHLHAVLVHEGRIITGHVDSVTVARGAVVRLPDRR